MLQVHGLRPADAKKNTSKDCDRRDNNNNIYIYIIFFLQRHDLLLITKLLLKPIYN